MSLLCFLFSIYLNISYFAYLKLTEFVYSLLVYDVY